MIRGIVNARREAVVRLRVRGPTGIETDVYAIVDSGSSAPLTLPAATIAALELTRKSTGGARMADGSIRQFDLYAAEVQWNGRWQSVIVSGVGREPLVGMRLLAGHRLRIDVVAGGAVEIAPLP